jgi:hypothetical protein
MICWKIGVEDIERVWKKIFVREKCMRIYNKLSQNTKKEIP